MKKNIFEEVDDFFRVFSDDEVGRFFFCNLPFWSLVYLIFWALVAYLGPYALMLMVPGVVVPILMNIILMVFYSGTEAGNKLSSLKFSIPLCLVLFIPLFGFPGLLDGFLFDFIRSKTFAEYYWWALRGWWNFFNHLNYFAEDTIPSKFYVWRFLYGHVVFMVLSTTFTIFFFYNYHQREVDEAKEHQEELNRAQEEEEAEKRRKLQDEERARVRAIREAQEQEEKKKLEKERREKMKEVTAKDPWDSGFL